VLQCGYRGFGIPRVIALISLTENRLYLNAIRCTSMLQVPVTTRCSTDAFKANAGADIPGTLTSKTSSAQSTSCDLNETLQPDADLCAVHTAGATISHHEMALTS
jgi:hypothetical protein